MPPANKKLGFIPQVRGESQMVVPELNHLTALVIEMKS
jgi:hypothetical protein